MFENFLVAPSEIVNLPTSFEKMSILVREGHFEQLFSKFLDWSILLVVKTLIAIIIFLIGHFLIKKIGKLLTSFFDKTEWEPSLEIFIERFVVVMLYVGLVVLIVNIVGKQPVSIAALLGAGGLAIGMAVKDNLANFAGGVMLLANRPFRAGDFVEVQGQSGTVQAIGILYTELIGFDGKLIYIPNGPLSTGNIINYSNKPIRRLEIVVGVSYGSDIKEVKNTLFDILKNHPMIEKEPEPIIILKELNDSSIDFAVRVYVKNADYWDLKFDLNEKIYDELNSKGIEIPFPQLTVHMADK